MVFEKDQLIFSENEECKYVGFIKSGQVKISSVLLSGKEIIYNIINSEQMFGENLIFSSSKNFRGDVIALEKSQIYLLTKDELEKLMMTNKDFLEIFMKQVSDFSKTLNLKLKLLTFNSVKEMILYYLDIQGGKIEYKSITKLAEILNLSRESLSRTLHDLDRNKIISITNKVIVKL